LIHGWFTDGAATPEYGDAGENRFEEENVFASLLWDVKRIVTRLLNMRGGLFGCVYWRESGGVNLVACVRWRESGDVNLAACT
jgi:hypothetical protein